MLKFYALGSITREVPREELERTDNWDAEMDTTRREGATEIAPGVIVRLLQVWYVPFGAVIAVWDDREGEDKT
jgi:hypothetical protein